MAKIRRRTGSRAARSVFTVAVVVAMAAAASVTASPSAVGAERQPHRDASIGASAVGGPGTIRALIGHSMSGPATQWPVGSVDGLAADRSGNLVLGQADHNRVVRVSGATNQISVAAGIGDPGTFAEGVPAFSAALDHPRQIVAEEDGSFYFLSSEPGAGSKLRFVDTAGAIHTISDAPAADRLVGNSHGDLFLINTDANTVVRRDANGAKTPVSLTIGSGTITLGAVASDQFGNLFISDTGASTIYVVTPSGNFPYADITGLQQSSHFGFGTQALAVDLAGQVYAAFSGQQGVWRARPDDHTFQHFAGGDDPNAVGYSGDGGPARQAQFGPVISGLATDAAGNVFIDDTFWNKRIRRVNTAEIVETVAGNGVSSAPPDGAPAPQAILSYPSGLVLDAAGNLFVHDAGNCAVRSLDPSGQMVTVAGTDDQTFNDAVRVPPGPGREINVCGSSPTGMNALATGPGGELYIATRSQIWVLKDGFLDYFFENPSDDVTPDPLAQQLSSVSGLATDEAGNVYVSDPDGHRVLRFDAQGRNGIVIAGTGEAGSSGDGGRAGDARLVQPAGLARDHAGNLYIADRAANVVRKVDPAGVISTVAGNGAFGAGGEDALATQAQLAAPNGVAVDHVGNLYIADSFNARVVRVSVAGYLTIVAGGGSLGSAGDGGPARGAVFTTPVAVAVDQTGTTLFIADAAVDVVRAVSLEEAYVPIVPTRVLDTRIGLGAPAGKLAGGRTVAVDLAPAGVPADSAAVVVNVTATEPDGAGFLTVYPCASAPPLASNLNYVAGQNIPNLVTSPLGADGKICIFTMTTTHVVVDVAGSYPHQTAYQAISPLRILDTRTGLGASAGKLPAGGTVALALPAGALSDASAVVMNVTATEPDGPGFLTVYPCGTERPLASNVNYVAGQNIPNLVTSPVGADGKVCIYTMTATHVVVDLNGGFPAASAYRAVVPFRVLDTRNGTGTATAAKVPADGVVRLRVVGVDGVPPSAGAVVMNVTVTEPDGPGFVTAYPCDAARPVASNLNYVAGQSIPNLVIARIGADGDVCLYTMARAHLVADLNGWQPS